jgi:arabinose-5-phosphate isomerase
LFVSKVLGRWLAELKSGFIAEKIASTLTSLGVPALFVHPTDALHGGLGIFEKADTVIAFSHSGATKELLTTLRHVVKLKIPIIGISGKSDSPLSRIAAHMLVYRVQDEGSPHGLAPMASTTTSLVIGDMLCAG